MPSWTITSGSIHAQPTLSGTEENDYFQTGGKAGTLYGYGGDDVVFHRITRPSGTLVIDLGDGNDTFQTEESWAALFYKYGNVNLHGGSGNDTVYATSGFDYIFGDDGDDRIYSITGGYDVSHGGSGNDQILNGGELYGDEGDDLLIASPNERYRLGFLDGGDGNDILDANYNGDTAPLIGGTGADIFLAHQGRLVDFNVAEGDRINAGFDVQNVFHGTSKDVFDAHEGDLIIRGSKQVYTVDGNGDIYRLRDLPGGVDYTQATEDWFV